MAFDENCTHISVDPHIWKLVKATFALNRCRENMRVAPRQTLNDLGLSPELIARATRY